MRFRFAPILLPILLLSAAPCFAQLTAFTGKVVGVTDGDTITVLDPKKKQHKVRLAGIDAPEAGQDWGHLAKEKLSQWVFGKEVTVVPRKKDRYGRIVGKVILFGYHDMGHTMVLDGYAWHFKRYSGEQTRADRKLYAAAEEDARKVRRGLWQYPAIAPWEYRAGKRPPEPSNSLFKTDDSATFTVVGNRNSRIYHWNPGCRDFFKIAAKNRVPFRSKEEAEAAGYRPAKNCN